MEYLDVLNSSAKKRSHKKSEEMENGDDELHSDTDDAESYHHFVEETELESYETSLDKEEGGMNAFLLFKETFQSNCPWKVHNPVSIKTTATHLFRPRNHESLAVGTARVGP